MPFFRSTGCSIAGIATAVPKVRFKVEDAASIFGTEIVKNFIDKTGITQCHRAVELQTASDLGFAAAKNLFANVNIDKNQIGVLIFVSQSPDYRKPATACVLQHRLGLSTNCAAYDVGLGCSGFVYGNQIMRSMLSTTNVKYGLLIVAETSSKQADPKDRTIGMMFGDAGSAILYENGTEEECCTLLKTDGSRFKSIIVPAGGFRDINPKDQYFTDSDGQVRSKFFSYMDGVGVFSFSILDVPNAMKEFLKHMDKQGNDFDYVFLHQANGMIIKQIAKRFGVSMDRVPLSLDRYGNTSGVTIPLTICDKFGVNKDGVVNVLAVGFGIGLSYGVTSFNIDTTNVLPIIETDEYYSEGRF